MKRIFKLRPTLLITSAVVAVACSSSYEDMPTPNGDGFEVSFSFDVADTALATASTTASATRADLNTKTNIEDIWIFQYGLGGALTKSQYIDVANASTATVSSVDIRYSTSKVVFIANAGSGFSPDIFATLSTLSKACRKVYSSLLYYYTTLPLSSSMSIKDISAEEVNNISLRHSAAAVTIKIDNNIPSSEWTLSSVQIINLQERHLYYPGDYSSVATYPTTSATLDCTLSSSLLSSALGSGVTLYLPMNKRGIISSNRTAIDKRNNAPADATAIRIKFENKVGITHNAFYTTYIGANDITDYNLLGNYHYSYTYTFDGIGYPDPGVEWE